MEKRKTTHIMSTDDISSNYIKMLSTVNGYKAKALPKIQLYTACTNSRV